MLAAQSEWPTVAAAGIGAFAALAAALLAKLRVGDKRRWDDELLNVASAFVAEARRVHTMCQRLADGGPPHHRTTTERRAAALDAAEDRFFTMRDLYVRLKLLAPRDGQRSARLMIEHTWQMIEVFGFGQQDGRAAQYPGTTPMERLRRETDEFIRHVRHALRVRKRGDVFTETELERERHGQQALHPTDPPPRPPTIPQPESRRD